MLLVVAYDVSHPVRRQGLHRLLRDFGLPRQKSLFECQLSPSEIVSLKWAVTKIIRPDTDGVRFYFVCAKCEKKLSGRSTGFYQGEPVVV